MERSDVYTYPYEGNLYINLTNRCTNNCEFCVRRGADGVGGHYLWIKKEPTAQEVIAQMDHLDRYREVVFCGFGEPMMRLPELLEVAAYAKEKGLVEEGEENTPGSTPTARPTSSTAGT